MTIKRIDLARTIQSKNAGPFTVTIDILFDDHEDYMEVVDSGTITPGLIASSYRIPERDVEGIYDLDELTAIKISFRSPKPPGHPADSDVYGGQ